MVNKNINQVVAAYFTDLRMLRGSGGATDERSLYVPLANLLNAVGGALRPKVFCVHELADQGVGHPDFGLYTTQQVQKGRPKSRQKPERGVIEVKSVDDDAWLTAESDQVAGYRQGYRQVLVTNARDFVLVERTTTVIRCVSKPSAWPDPPRSSTPNWRGRGHSPTRSAPA